MSENKGGNMEQGIENVKMEGVGHAEVPVKPAESDSEAVEYSAGADIDPMEELAAEADNEAVEINEEEVPQITDTVIEEETPKTPEDNNNLDKAPAIDPEKVTTDPTPSESDKPVFDPKEEQDARYDSEVEGGIVKNKSTGPTMSQAENRKERKKDPGEGGTLKQPPNMSGDSVVNKYEVTGFDVDYQSGDNTYSVSIRDYFDDLDTAFASVNSDKYLMPIENGFKIATIRSGAPVISFNERQLYHYKEGKWSRS